MSEIKVNSIKGVAASTAALTINNTDGTCTANITNNLSNRNIIINGAAQINQRGNQTGVGQGNTYTLDRWEFFGQSTSAQYTITQSTDAPNGFGNSLKLDCTTVDSSLDANTENTLFTKFEGQDLQSIAKGTSAAKKLTLSFYVKTNKTGTYCVHLKDADNNRDVSGSYTVSDTNWNRYTISFPADTTGAFDNDNNKSLDVKWFLCCGSNRNTGSLNTVWRSNVNTGSATGQVNLADSTSNEWSITGVQLEVDHTGSGVATDFEHRSFAQELQLCRRYFQIIGPASGEAQHGTNIQGALRATPFMRANPSIAIIDNSSNCGKSGAAPESITSVGTIYVEGETTGMGGWVEMGGSGFDTHRFYHIYGGKFSFSAEL